MRAAATAGSSRLLVVRRALPTDRSALARLGERTFREAYSHNNAAENMDAYVASSFTEDAIGRDLADPLAHYFVATTAASPEPAGPLVAYAKLLRSEAPACVATPAPVELSRLYVSHELHGTGAAHELIAAAHAEARALGGRSIWLGVWEQNPRARAFYAKLGFRDVGEHEFVLGSDVQIDRVLVREL